MEAREIITVVVSLIVGLGAAAITAAAGARKARQDRMAEQEREARASDREMARALRDYQRALVDVMGDMEDEVLFNRSGPIEGRYDRYIESPRAEAYHYFHLFPDEKKYLLRWPLDSGGPGNDPGDTTRIQSTVDLIDAFLKDRAL
ncbi:hypothetical protein ACX80I_01035 [Arthrobacter sp. MDT3-44]